MLYTHTHLIEKDRFIWGTERKRGEKQIDRGFLWPVCLHCDGLLPVLVLLIAASLHLRDPVTLTTNTYSLRLMGIQGEGRWGGQGWKKREREAKKASERLEQLESNNSAELLEN